MKITKISKNTMNYCIARLEALPDCKTAASILKQDLQHIEMHNYFKCKEQQNETPKEKGRKYFSRKF